MLLMFYMGISLAIFAFMLILKMINHSDTEHDDNYQTKEMILFTIMSLLISLMWIVVLVDSIIVTIKIVRDCSASILLVNDNERRRMQAKCMITESVFKSAVLVYTIKIWLEKQLDLEYSEGSKLYTEILNEIKETDSNEGDVK